MKTPLPTRPKPFDEKEILMLTERLEFIEEALEAGKTVIATRPIQGMPHKTTSKVIEKIEFHERTDADLVTVTGGALNLLDPSYEFKAYTKGELPEEISENMCLAHLKATMTPEGIEFDPKPE